MQLLFEIESLLEKLSVRERGHSVQPGYNILSESSLLLHFFNRDMMTKKKKKPLEFSWKPNLSQVYAIGTWKIHVLYEAFLQYIRFPSCLKILNKKFER